MKGGKKHYMEVNQKQLATILGVTDRRIRQLINEFGLFHNNEHGGKREKRYDLGKCVQEFIQYQVDAETNRGASLNKEQVSAEHEEIKKKISMLKLKRLRRQLHSADDVEEFLTSMLVNFRDRLLSIPQKTAPILASVDDVNKILEILEKEVCETIEELSEYDPLEIEKEKDYERMDDDMEEDEEEEE
ncbi:DNA-packaging protein [Anaerotignum sp.]|uniref:DNA-packaging protein n=1 Tax=Anaerotignum sp. TaxID=2039241 RepID=UPI0028ADF10D|nr:DNA-packaging protein [Anaerotignum sp.]